MGVLVHVCGMSEDVCGMSEDVCVKVWVCE